MDANEVQLGRIRVEGAHTALSLTCDALGCRYQNEIMIISASGPESSVKALLGVMHTDSTARIETTYDCPAPFHSNCRLGRCQKGYFARKAKLGLNTWHVLFLAKIPGLMPVLSEEALWNELRSERHTTPVLRSWMPWIMEELLRSRTLDKLEQFGCSGAVLGADTKRLDDIVSSGLRRRELFIR